MCGRDIQMLTSEKVTSQCVGDIIDLSTKDPFHRSRKKSELKNDNRERQSQRDRERLFFICVIDELIMLPGLIRASFQSLFVLGGWKSIAHSLIFCLSLSSIKV